MHDQDDAELDTHDAVALVGQGQDEHLLSDARLRLRLAMLVSFVVAVLSALYFFLVSQAFSTLTPSLEQDLRWKALGGLGELSHSADLGLLTEDHKQLSDSSARYVADPDIVYVAFETKTHDGSPRVIFQRGDAPQYDISRLPPLELGETPSLYVGWAPVSVEGMNVGRVQLVVSKQRLHAGTELYRRLVLAGLVGAAAALLLALLFANRYIVPILQLTQRAVRELEVTTAAALASTRAKSRFLANMSHEIRTPMNGVLGMVHLLQRTKMDRGQRHYVDVIAGSAKSLLKIVNDILDFSKLEAQSYELTPEPCEVRSVIEQTVQLFDAKASERQLRLRCDVGPEVPNTVLVDGDRLRQVLSNLLSNALKFTKHGQVVVQVSCAEPDAASSARRHLRVRVSDTGIGVPRSARPRLFRAFSQVDESAARVHEGTGLGLAISRRLVELMGGDISYEERRGGGSVFTFEVPVSVCAAAKAPDARPPLDARFHCERPVLVVDDNEINQLVAMEMLESLGLDVEIVGGGREAVTAVASGDYALVLMDCQMPDVDGYQATRAIRANCEGERKPPIVACTAHALEEEREKVLACGMDDYIVKPIEPEVLHRTLARWLPVRESAFPRALSTPDSSHPASSAPRPRSSTSETRLLARARLLDPPEDLPILLQEHARSARVVEVFLRTLPSQIGELRRFAEAGQLTQVKNLAHKIKGGAASIGAMRMAAVCDRLQLCAETIESAQATECVKLIARMYELVQAALIADAPAEQTS